MAIIPAVGAPGAEVCVALKDCCYVGAGFEDRGYRLGAFDCGRASVVCGEGESEVAVEAAEKLAEIPAAR